jgi:acetyl esterase
MPVDPCFAALLADPRNELRRPPAHVPLAAMRQGNRAFLLVEPKAPLHALENLIVPGPGGPLPLRLYRPNGDRSLPLVLFMHGGGFVLGDLDTHDSICSVIAHEANCVVCAVDYRLAPESRFPAPVDDGAAALAYLLSHAQTLGFDASRIAFCGDSAGANIVTAVAMRARAHHGAVLRGLALLYPTVDPACNSGSMNEFGRGHMLTRSGVEWFWSSYLGSPADALNPEVCLLRADLLGLPRTTIVTAECDPLRDEGEALAARLRAAGVETTLRRWPGMLHGFAGMQQITPDAALALRTVATDLAAAFACGK